jgi:hypothetical protein
MRIKIIEKLVSMEELYSTVKNVFNSQLTISMSSYVSDESLFILGISEKGIMLIIHASLDYEFERTYISTILFNISSLAQLLEIGYESIDDVKYVEEKLLQSLDMHRTKKIKYPFTKLSEFQIESDQRKRKVYSLESKIISALNKELFPKIGYSDDIMKFPFSIASTEGKWEDWEDIYHPYVSSIEKGIINTGIEYTKIYRNYDFALNSDIFQRIFDLTLISKQESDPEILTQQNEDAPLYDYEITFLYCNRSHEPYSYMDMLKLMNELKNFSKKYKADKKNLCFNLRTNLILISSSGYEPNIKEYLREHLFREIDYVIPIIVIPPMIEDVWHNFFEYEDLLDSKQKKREELGNIIRISNKTEVSPSFRITRLKDAKTEYADIIEREQMAKFDKDYLTKWFWILNVPKSSDILTPDKKDDPREDSPEVISEKIEIS